MDYTIKWELVKNSVSTRLKDDSLLHTLNVNKKIKRQTKIFNQKLKKVRKIRSYKHFLSLKEQALIECPDSETETDDEPGLDYEDYKDFYKEERKTKLGRLRKFLKLCVRMKGRPNYKNKPLKKEGKKPAGVRRLKNSKQSRTKSNTNAKGEKTLLQCWIKSKLKPSESNFEEENPIPDAAETVSRCLRKRSLILTNKNRGQGVNNEKSNCAEKSQSIRNEFPDISKSICSPESTVINDSMAGDHLEETSIIKTQSSSKNHRSGNLSESDHEFQTVNNPSQDDCVVNINATEHQDASGTASDSGKIFNENNLYLEHDLTLSKAENDREGVFSVPYQTDQYDLTSDHDSGNNSLSDSNSLDRNHERRSNKGVGRSNCHKKTTTKRNLDTAKKKVIPLDEIELNEVATRKNETIEIGSLSDDSDTPYIKLATENSLEKERGIGNDDGAAEQESPEFMDIQNMSEQSGVEFSTGDEANKGGSILKIQNIQYYKEGCEQRTIQSLNNLTYGVVDCLDENVENIPTSVPDEQALGFTKSSVDYFFSSDQLNNSHKLLVNEISNGTAEVNKNSSSGIININRTSDWTEKSTLENDEQWKCNTSSIELSFSETRPRSLSPSSIKSSSSFCSRSYDEEFEHCVEAKLLAGTDEQLKCNETCDDKNLLEKSYDISQNEKPSFLIESHEEQNESITENVQVSGNSEFVDSHDSNESSDIADSVPLPKSTPKKRPISSIDEDYRVLANVLSKKSRPLKQTSYKQLEISSRVCGTSESKSRELQPAENEDDSPNRSNKNPSTSKPKRKHRPRTVSFLENGVNKSVHIFF